MAVIPETPNAAAAMEAKRSRKRPLKPSSHTNPPDELTHSKNSKKKKRQTTVGEGFPDRTKPAEEENQTESNSISTNEGGLERLKHGVCIVPVAKRFLLLHSFLKLNLSKKVVVICSSWQAAKFYSDLLKHMKFDGVYFHGKMDNEKFGSSGSNFSKAETGILFTDIPVEGLQVSHVDWIVQYDPPDIPQGWSSNERNILTFLTSNELKYLNHLQEAKVQVVEYKFDNKKLSKGEPQLEKLVAKNHYLYTSAVKAYRSYILAYNQRSKDVFNVDHLDLMVFRRSVERLESMDIGMRKPINWPFCGRQR